MSTGKVVLGTVAGLALGAIAGILFAPEKGSATRKQIMDKGDDYVDKLKSKAENLVGKGKARYDDAKEDVLNAAEKFKHDVAADIRHATS